MVISRDVLQTLRGTIPTLDDDDLSDIIEYLWRHGEDEVVARLESTWPQGGDDETHEEMLAREATWPQGDQDRKAVITILESLTDAQLQVVEWPVEALIRVDVAHPGSVRVAPVQVLLGDPREHRHDTAAEQRLHAEAEAEFRRHVALAAQRGAQ